MTRLTPKLHSLMTLVPLKSLKCYISMNNGLIALKFARGAVSIEEYIQGGYGTHGKIRAIKGKYAQLH